MIYYSSAAAMRHLAPRRLPNLPDDSYCIIQQGCCQGENTISCAEIILLSQYLVFAWLHPGYADNRAAGGI